jgi:hypothetical protein
VAPSVTWYVSKNLVHLIKTMLFSRLITIITAVLTLCTESAALCTLVGKGAAVLVLFFYLADRTHRCVTFTFKPSHGPVPIAGLNNGPNCYKNGSRHFWKKA